MAECVRYAFGVVIKNKFNWEDLDEFEEWYKQAYELSDEEVGDIAVGFHNPQWGDDTAVLIDGYDPYTIDSYCFGSFTCGEIEQEPSETFLKFVKERFPEASKPQLLVWAENW